MNGGCIEGMPPNAARIAARRRSCRRSCRANDSQVTEFPAFPTWHRPCIALLGSFCPPEANPVVAPVHQLLSCSPASGVPRFGGRRELTAGGKQPRARVTRRDSCRRSIDQLLAGGAVKPTDGTATTTGRPALLQSRSSSLSASARRPTRRPRPRRRPTSSSPSWPTSSRR